MNTIPVFAFSAWSNTGKTTILEKVTALLKKHGFRVAVIKHDAHDFEIDKEGKDSWRFTRAGADMTVISSPKKTAVIEQRPLALSAVLSLIHDVDIILIEGYNQAVSAGEFCFHAIGISRRETGKGFRLPLHNYSALVTDEEIKTDLPVFPLDNPEGLADFLEGFIPKSSRDPN